MLDFVQFSAADIALSERGASEEKEGQARKTTLWRQLSPVTRNLHYIFNFADDLNAVHG